MHVVVCLKAIPDPDAPAAALQIDPVRLTASGGSTVANPFDENALELALRLTAAGGGTVTVMSAGDRRRTTACARRWPPARGRRCGWCCRSRRRGRAAMPL